MIVKQCFALNILGGDYMKIDFEIGENQNGQIAIRVGHVEITEEDLLKIFGRTLVTVIDSVAHTSDLPDDADVGAISVVKYADGDESRVINQPYLFTADEGWIPFGNNDDERIDKLEEAVEDINHRIDELPKGIVYRGAVDYYKDLPTDAEQGDAYTVRYKGESGEEPWGAEFVQVQPAGKEPEWVGIGPDTTILEERVVALEEELAEVVSDVAGLSEIVNTLVTRMGDVEAAIELLKKDVQDLKDGKLDKADIYVLFGGEAGGWVEE